MTHSNRPKKDVSQSNIRQGLEQTLDIKLPAPGYCVAFTLLRLRLWYLERIISAINSLTQDALPTDLMSYHTKVKTEASYLSKTHALAAELKQTNQLSKEQKDHLADYAKQLTLFQNSYTHLKVPTGGFNRLFSKSDEQFTQEFSLAGFFTEKHLARVLKNIIKPNRLIFAGTHNHALGIKITHHHGQYIFYDANNPADEAIFNTSEELAHYIFSSMKSLNPNCATPFSFRAFIDTHNPLQTYIKEKQAGSKLSFTLTKIGSPARRTVNLDHYPSHEELLTPHDDEKPTQVSPTHYAHNMTGLHIAALTGCTRSMDYYLAQKENINAKSINDYTPLHWAAVNGQRDVVILLLKSRADTSATCENTIWPLRGRYTALDLAKQAKADDIVEILEKHQKGFRMDLKWDYKKM